MINLKTLYLLLIFAFTFTSCSLAQEKSEPESPAKVNLETKRFESKAGNFSINISQTPFQTRDLKPEPGKEPGKQFLWQFERTSYGVLYSEIGENDLSTALDQMNSGVRKTILGNGWQLISEKEISFGKFPGREFRSILPNGANQIGRNYLVNNMGYLLTAAFVDEKSEKEALEVLDSFKLLTEKK